MNTETKASPLTETTSMHVCKNCSNQFEGKYCNQCGEKVIHHHDRSILHFLEGVFHIITHADAKLFRNLRLMLLKPGFVSKNFIEGIRQPYLKPIPMFFVGNLIYFLFPVFETFTTSLASQRQFQPYSEMVQTIVDKKVEAKGITLEALEEKYNAKTSSLSKLMLILFVPALAVVFSILNFKKSRYFADHLLISLEFMTYMIFYNTVILGFLIYGVSIITNWIGWDLTYIFNNELALVLPLTILSCLYFLVRAERIFYDQRWVWAVVKSVVILASIFYILTGYRFVLFHVTINTI